MTATLDIERRLEDSGALLTGHFQLSSGRHSDRYVQCARLLCLPREAEAVCRALAERFAHDGVDAVVGPALGGVIVAHEVARALDVPAYFTERKDGVMTLRRGFALEPGLRVLVVEDVVTTGGSVKEVLAVLEGMGVEIVGVGALVQRAPESPFGEHRFEALLPVEVASWEPSDCPLCAAGDAPVKPGSRPGA